MDSSPLQVLFLVTLGLSALVHVNESKCNKPEVNCRLPNCRCWDDPDRPGNFSDEATPQIVTLTFSYALNNSTAAMYSRLFDGLVNPNGCPARGTFFTQFQNTDVESIRKLYQQGHEMALTSSDGSIPKDKRGWVESLFQSSEKLYDAGISRMDIRGARSPGLYMGGDDELRAEMQFGMDYEASCVIHFDQSDSSSQQMLWPYTYDNIDDIPQCAMGKKINTTFPGMWQMLVPEMRIGTHTCSTLSSCSPYIKTTADVFTMLYNSFSNHYYKGRAPMTLYIDPQWLLKDVQVKGLQEFLSVINKFPETWMVTMSQALQWVKDPVPMYKTVKFMPWECDEETKRFHARYNRR